MSATHIRNGVGRRSFLTGTAGLIAALAAGGPILAACGGKDSPATTGLGEPQRGGTLRVGMGGGASTETLDPHNAVTSISIARVAQFAETLMRYSPEFKLEPHLAESVTGDATATTWTITLRKGITFHDGKPLTSKDVLFTFKKILDKTNPGSAAPQLANLLVDKIEVVDDLTIVLPFSKPFAAFTDALAMAATSAIRIVPEGFDVAKPIGTGPFKFDSFTPGQRSKFVRNDAYWVADRPYLDVVEIIDMNDESARINALTAKQVEAITSVPASNVAVVKADADLTLLASPSGGWNPIVMRTDTAPFDDVRVRQAFRLIADRDQLVGSALAGQGTVANDVFGRYDPAYNTSLEQRKADIEKAKGLLEEAGQAGMSAQLVTSKIAEGVVETAQVFAQQAAAAGVTIDVLEVQPTDFWSKYFLQAPLTQSNWATRNYLMQALDSMMPDSPYNETFWKNDEWLGLVDQAMASTDETKRAELIGKAQEIEYNEGGYINWGWYDIVDAHSSKVGGFVPDSGGISLTTFRFGDVWMSS